MSTPSPASSASETLAPSHQRLAMDNLIRRELRVGDPNDPEQVARALLTRYHGDNRARAIEQEARGLPFLQAQQLMAPAAAAHTATSIDLEQAQSDVDKDLRELTSNNLLKDIAAELEGWSDAIRSSADEGIQAARFGLDPRNRDRAFGVRRTLGDYARMARLLGAFTPAMNRQFRSLAQSIDEVCAVILVMLGESLANNGFSGGRFLLQAPFTEMQTRRDAVMNALQNLLGSLRFHNAPNEWPRGIDAYRRLFDALEAQGQGDLRALLTEQELGRVMDNLVRRSARGSSEGLRALGSTAQLDLQRVYRLIHFGYRLVDPESPPLTSFLESLRLFADGFGSAGGSRLLRVARPPIVFYGLYGSDEEQPADRRLTQLTVWRGRLASQSDCFSICACTETTAVCQVLLDKALYDVDRAIDLYAVGQHELGLPELRAAAYSYLLEEVRTRALCNFGADLDATLLALTGWLRPLAGSTQLPDWQRVPVNSANPDSAAVDFEARRLANDPVAGSSFHFTDLLYQELCLQRDAEQRWELLAAQMAPQCIPMARIFGPGGELTGCIEDAMAEIADGVPSVDTDCALRGPDIPAHLETALDAIAFNNARTGAGRP
jgi:hypothetical protein